MKRFVVEVETSGWVWEPSMDIHDPEFNTYDEAEKAAEELAEYSPWPVRILDYENDKVMWETG